MRDTTPSVAPKRPLNVAMIGYAFMGRAHSHAWRNVESFFTTPRVDRKVLVGRDAEAVSSAAQQYGWAEWSTDWREVVERPDIDVVDICAPGWMHVDVAVAALAAGKHVLVEKPLATSIDDAEAMVAAAATARRRGVQSMVGFNYRRVPALALARDLIAEGRLGAVRQVRASYLQDWLSDEQAPMSWRLRREAAGSGALGDIASHAVDLVQFLLQDTVVEASGRLHTFVPARDGSDGPEPVTVDDAAWATMALGDGAVASIEASRVALGRKNALGIEVYGSRGSLLFDLESLNELHFFDGSAGIRQQGFTRILATESEHPYAGAWWPPGHVLGWEHTFTHQLHDFLDAIRTGRTPEPSFETGLQVQRVLAAVEQSAETGGAAVRVHPTAPTTSASDSSPGA